MGYRIHIYHSNDLHSHFEQWPKMITYFKEAKSRHQKRGEASFFFDIGDHVDRSNPISEATMGQENVNLMNEVGYHDVTIGNNEGITLSKRELEDLYKNANFNTLIANLFDEDGNRPTWIKPYSIHQMENGLNLGVIGVTVAYPAFYDLLGWKVRDPYEMLPELVHEVRKKADIVILLSHLGINEDERIAESIQGIDVILGGHTHHLFKNGKMINGTLLGAAGKHGKYLGEVIIEMNLMTKQVIRKEGYAISLENTHDCEKTIHKLKTAEEESKLILQKQVVFLKEPLSLAWFDTSPIVSLLAEGLKEWCNTEISMVNAGVLLEGLEEGPVTRSDLHRICPHPINPCKVILRGDEFKEIILHAFTEKMQNLELKGFGFRGKVLGRMCFDGVEVVTTKLADGLMHVKDIKVLGEPIDPKRKYTIATLDMFTFGYLYPELTHAKNKQYYLPEMLRDVLEWKLQKI